MKKLLFISAALCGMIALTALKPIGLPSSSTSETTIRYDDFCDGWEDGYCEGWKDIKGQYAICPITPICPIPEIGQDTYKGGYNRGFKAGSRAAYNN